MTDNWEYTVRHNSSVDRIERAMRFYRVAADFLELLDLDDDVEPARSALKFLQSKAMTIAAKEARSEDTQS